MKYQVGDIVTFNKNKCWREDRPVFDCELLGHRQRYYSENVWLLRPVEDLPRPINRILTTENTDGTFWCSVDFFRPAETKPVTVDASDLL